MTLEELRTRLTALDQQLLALVAERQRLSREVAEAKLDVLEAAHRSKKGPTR